MCSHMCLCTARALSLFRGSSHLVRPGGHSSALATCSPGDVLTGPCTFQSILDPVPSSTHSSEATLQPQGWERYLMISRQVEFGWEQAATSELNQVKVKHTENVCTPFTDVHHHHRGAGTEGFRRPGDGWISRFFVLLKWCCPEKLCHHFPLRLLPPEIVNYVWKYFCVLIGDWRVRCHRNQVGRGQVHCSNSYNAQSSSTPVKNDPIQNVNSAEVDKPCARNCDTIIQMRQREELSSAFATIKLYYL